MSTSALLVLEDGSVFQGIAIGAKGKTLGEVVFNTAMTGYQEILTDPSYAGQIVTLTYPHIGNVGVNAEDQESTKAWAAGLIIRDLPLLYSNWRAEQSLDSYLQEQGVVGIANIDTRRLTRILREKGALRGCIVSGGQINEQEALTAAQKSPSMQGLDLAKVVSTSKNYTWNQGSIRVGAQPAAPTFKPKRSYHVVAYDYGIKHSILRLLVDRGCQITVVPAKTSAKEVLKLKPDGIFLSNGPGDPAACDYAITAIREFLTTNIPVFGICLGHQLLGLAAGAKTVKMKFGHHGSNHPVQNLQTGKVLISSQNHGFAVDEKTLPNSVRATYRSLFDNSLQGIQFKDKPVFGFQGHPEAAPGPHDLSELFDQFIVMMDEALLGSQQTIHQVELNKI